jgi:hypothetical protein
MLAAKSVTANEQKLYGYGATATNSKVLRFVSLFISTRLSR